jgi:hypothetical protein
MSAPYTPNQNPAEKYMETTFSYQAHDLSSTLLVLTPLNSGNMLLNIAHTYKTSWLFLADAVQTSLLLANNPISLT